MGKNTMLLMATFAAKVVINCCFCNFPAIFPYNFRPPGRTQNIAQITQKTLIYTDFNL